ncbi:hypothetical protein Pan44_07660 [Caulifigura coniformis]|uniref:Uncharacterized protein n=1 Tax=Caulifigura coniformis TaxID=2527983 RepID=A0A517S9F3_9PLAN|nr:hypothetical protein Pan44_07660 [Caulifigura coniformis]
MGLLRWLLKIIAKSRWKSRRCWPDVRHNKSLSGHYRAQIALRFLNYCSASQLTPVPASGFEFFSCH